MPGPIITAAVAIGKAIAGSKIATAAVIAAGSSIASAKFASWQRAKRRRELENQRPDPRRYQTGDEEPFAQYVYGIARVSGYPFYVRSQYNSFTTFQALSVGPCEGLCGFDGLTANPVVIVGGEEVVRCKREAMTGGDKIVPLDGTKYSGAIEIREYFLADGSQGSDWRRTDPLSTYTTPQFAPGPTGPWSENYHEGDGFVREAPTQTQPAGDATAWSTGIPVWSANHRVEGYAWVAVTYTQKVWTENGQEAKVFQGTWPRHRVGNEGAADRSLRFDGQDLESQRSSRPVRLLERDQGLQRRADRPSDLQRCGHALRANHRRPEVRPSQSASAVRRLHPDVREIHD